MPLVAVQNNATTKVFADSIYVTKYFFRQIKEVPDFYVLQIKPLFYISSLRIFVIFIGNSATIS